MSSAACDILSPPKGPITNPFNAPSHTTHSTLQSPVHSVQDLRPLRLRIAPDTEQIMIQRDTRCSVRLQLDVNHDIGQMSTMSVTRSLKDLQEKSESGCIYCTIMCITRKIYASEMPREMEKCLLDTGHMSPQSTRICWCWPRSSRGMKDLGGLELDTRDILLQLSLCPDAEPWGWFNRSESIPASAGSMESIKFCRDRLRECVTSHTECQPRKGILPTRLYFWETIRVQLK
jgi:hypothetical protein